MTPERQAGSEPSLVTKISLVHEALAAGRIDHAFGGALALAYYGEPRVTIDIDLNVFIPAGDFDRVAAALQPLGVDTAADSGLIARDEQVRTWWGRNPIDLFFAYDPFHDAMAREKRLVEFGDGRIPILSPEHLLVCKVIFDRSKDWIDIEQVLIAETVLSRDEIMGWLDRILDPTDPRILRFADLWQRTR